MSELTEKIAYLRGLADGMNLDKESNEGKLITEIIDVLGDMGADVDSLFDIVDDIDEAVSNIEDEVFDDEYFEDEDEYDDDLFELECPNCGDTVILDEDALDQDQIVCPYCKEEIELDFDCDGDCSCCDGNCE